MAIRSGISFHRKGRPMLPPFVVADDLAAWLTQLGSHYAPYAAPLWTYGVRTIQELSNASAATLKQAGVQSDLHIDNIRATAAQQGVCWREFRARSQEARHRLSHMAVHGRTWMHIAHGRTCRMACGRSAQCLPTCTKAASHTAASTHSWCKIRTD